MGKGTITPSSSSSSSASSSSASKSGKGHPPNKGMGTNSPQDEGNPAQDGATGTGGVGSAGTEVMETDQHQSQKQSTAETPAKVQVDSDSVGNHVDTAANDPDKEKLERQLEREEKKAEAKTQRTKYAKMLWPTDQRLKEYTSQSGRDPRVEPHIHVAHLLNRTEFAEAWQGYLDTPGGSSQASRSLKQVRELAIRLSFTKGKKAEMHKRTKDEEKKTESKSSSSKSAGGGRTSSSAAKQATPSSSSSRKEEAGGKRRKDAQRAASPKPGPSNVHSRLGTKQSGKRNLSTSSAGSMAPPRRQPRQNSPSRSRNKSRSVAERDRDVSVASSSKSAGSTSLVEEDETMDDSVTLHVNESDLDITKGSKSADKDLESEDYAGAAKTSPNRIVILAGDEGTVPISKQMWEKFRSRFSHLVAQQQEDLDQSPILLEEFWHHGGRIIIEPANEESRDKIIEIVKDKITLNEHALVPKKIADMPATATLSFRIEGPGKVEDLLLCPKRGICRLNGWNKDIVKGIRILKYPDSDTGTRYVRVSCTEPVVKCLRAKGGVFYCGVGKASAQWKHKQLHEDLEVTFGQQS